MAFYQGGQRFASMKRNSGNQQRPAATDASSPAAAAAPSRDQPLSSQVHPLRQNSVQSDSAFSARPSQNDTTTRTPSSRQNSQRDIPSNPKSYAVRAQAKPDLSLDTSPRQPSNSAFTASASPGDAYSPQEPLSSAPAFEPSRRPSVPDRSPLQKLEVTLGDISKEEKRARMEEAEHAARRRASKKSGSNRLSGGVPTSRDSQRRPASNGEQVPSNTSRSRSNQTEGQPRSALYTQSSTRAQDKRQSSSDYDYLLSRDRRYGYDSALTGGAAAAAVGAYQSARMSRRAPNTTADDATSLQADGTDTTTAQQSRSLGAGQTTGNRTADRMPQAQQQLQEERTGARFGSMAARTYQDADPVPRRDVQTDTSTGPRYTLPPQTAAGQQAANRTGPPNDQLQDTEPGGRNKNLRFSGLMHPSSEGTHRRYQAVPYLDEWKKAGTAILTADDFNTPSQEPDNVAWWERDQTGAQRSQPSRARDLSNKENASQPSSFEPHLRLRCGPLLRYTGMRGDRSPESEAMGRRFWRGSVMIVADDSMSSNAPPVLRLFKQSSGSPAKTTGQTQAPNGPQGYGQHSNQKQDLIAGQTKCSPTGATLFVKPVEHVQSGVDSSLREDETGLFTVRPPVGSNNAERQTQSENRSTVGRAKEVPAHRLHVERGLTFWRFNIEVELSAEEAKIGYSINRGPTISFWVPALDQSMNIMFHSCNGFSLSVDPNVFSGPDPLWRDVLNQHQQRPFHVMIGGGDQIYNDASMRDTQHFKEWLSMRNPEHKHSAPFSHDMQEELENFYLNRYAMWFSQGLFGMANSQIPMINLWDDHDIIDGFGSYPHHFMSTPAFTGLGSIAFKYYMLFQHQSLPTETTDTEPSWILGAAPGPYISQLGRSLYMSLGRDVALVGLDCRTERMRDEVLSQESYDLIFDRLYREIVKGEVKHLLVLLGIPIAYPRMNFAENILTSRAMDPVKAIARMGLMGNFINKFDGGVEILDDLDDHWTAKHHKAERKWFIEELQDLAAAKSVRITILGGDVHLAAVGQFFSNRKLGIPKDQDHRYMPNVISSAIVNTPPPDNLADFLNRRNKVHHFDKETDEDMIPLFTHDVNGNHRNNHHLLPRRNWCSIRSYAGDLSPPPSPTLTENSVPSRRARSFSLTRRSSWNGQTDSEKPGLFRRLSRRVAPPSSFREPVDAGTHGAAVNGTDQAPQNQRWSSDDGTLGGVGSHDGASMSTDGARPNTQRSQSFQRRPSTAGSQQWNRDRTGRQGHIDLQGGLQITFNCEINQKNPAGTTMPYRMIVPALFYTRHVEDHHSQQMSRVSNLFGNLGSRRKGQKQIETEGLPYENIEPATPAVQGSARYTTLIDGRGQSDPQAFQQMQARGVAGSAGQTDGSLNQAGSVNDRGGTTPIRSRPVSGENFPRQQQRAASGPPDLDKQRGPGFQQANDTSGGSTGQIAANGPPRAPPKGPTNYGHINKAMQQPSISSGKHINSDPPKSRPQSERPSSSGNPPHERPFGDPSLHQIDTKRAPPPMVGLAPPLGRVNNRLELQPTNIPAAPPQTNPAQPHSRTPSQDQRRVVSDPARPSKSYEDGRAGEKPLPAPATGHTSTNTGGRDPYAHLYPEAVEAEFDSADDFDEDEDDYDSEDESPDRHPQHRRSGSGHHPIAYNNLPSNDSLALNMPQRATANVGGGYGAAAQHQPQQRNRDSNISAYDSAPESPYTDSKRASFPPPPSKRSSKIDRLTGTDNPVGANGKAAKRLGVVSGDHGDMRWEDGGAQMYGGGEAAEGSRAGGFRGFVRRLSQGGGRRLSKGKADFI